MVNIGLLFVLMAVKKMIRKWTTDHIRLAETAVGDVCIWLHQRDSGYHASIVTETSKDCI